MYRNNDGGYLSASHTVSLIVDNIGHIYTLRSFC